LVGGELIGGGCSTSCQIRNYPLRVVEASASSADHGDFAEAGQSFDRRHGQADKLGKPFAIYQSRLILKSGSNALGNRIQFLGREDHQKVSCNMVTGWRWSILKSTGQPKRK
jgi:hypothetical protein